MKAILTIEGDVRDAGQLAALIEALCKAEGAAARPQDEPQDERMARHEPQEKPQPRQARTYADGKRVDVKGLEFEEVPPEEGPQVTADDVRAAMVAAIDAGRRNDVMAVLKAHGAASLTDLGEADYPAVVAELGAM